MNRHILRATACFYLFLLLGHEMESANLALNIDDCVPKPGESASEQYFSINSESVFADWDFSNVRMIGVPCLIECKRLDLNQVCILTQSKWNIRQLTILEQKGDSVLVNKFYSTKHNSPFLAPYRSYSDKCIHIFPITIKKSYNSYKADFFYDYEWKCTVSGTKVEFIDSIGTLKTPNGNVIKNAILVKTEDCFEESHQYNTKSYDYQRKLLYVCYSWFTPGFKFPIIEITRIYEFDKLGTVCNTYEEAFFRYQ